MVSTRRSTRRTKKSPTLAKVKIPEVIEISSQDDTKTMDAGNVPITPDDMDQYLYGDAQPKSDMMLSQVSQCEVGWNFTSPTAKYVNTQNGNIADIEKFMGKEEKNPHSGTPPLLGLWMDEKPDSPQTVESSVEIKKRSAKPKKKRASGSNKIFTSKQLIERLATVLESTKDEGRQQNLRDSISKLSQLETSTTNLNDSAKLKSRNSPAVLRATTSKHSSPQLFSPGDSNHSDDAGNSPLLPKSNHSPGTHILHVSSEDLWTDEELFNDDSFVIKATQQILTAESLVTPIGVKRKNTSSTPNSAQPKAKRSEISDSDNQKNLVNKVVSTHQNVIGQGTNDKKKFVGKLAFVPFESPKPITRTSVTISSDRKTYGHSKSSLTTRFNGNIASHIEPQSVPTTSSVSKHSLYPEKAVSITSSDASATRVPTTEDNSMTDELLLTLAEPDEWLDSQTLKCSAEEGSQQQSNGARNEANTEKDDEFDGFADDDLSENQLVAFLDIAESQVATVSTQCYHPVTSSLDVATSEWTEKSSITNSGSVSESMPSSQGQELTASQCTANEIRKKRELALQRRANKLKLSTKR